MIYSQIFHHIFNFNSKNNLKKKSSFENFNISENNIINVELAQVLQHYANGDIWSWHGRR